MSRPVEETYGCDTCRDTGYTLVERYVERVKYTAVFAAPCYDCVRGQAIARPPKDPEPERPKREKNRKIGSLERLATILIGA